MSEDIYREFVYDARDHLATAGAKLLDLEKNPGDLDSLNALMGTLHTLKGNSGILELQNLYKLMHHSESLLQTIREKQIDCPAQVIDLLLQVLDTVEAILNRLENDENDSADWLGALNQALSEAETKLEENETHSAVVYAGDEADDYSQVARTPGSPPEAEGGPGLEIAVTPGAPSLIALADGDLGRAGDLFPARVAALFQAGGSGLVVDLKGLSSLTKRELRLVWAASRENPDRTAFVADPAEQPDLYRLFKVLGLDQRLNLFADQEPALARLANPI